MTAITAITVFESALFVLIGAVLVFVGFYSGYRVGKENGFKDGALDFMDRTRIGRK